MTDFILRIFDFLRRHRLVGLLSFLAVTALLVLSLMRLGYKEDIADFMPVDAEQQNALKVYQDISGANKIFAVFQYRDSLKADPDAMVAGVDAFVEAVEKADTAHSLSSILAEVDMEKMTEVADFVYTNIPYFLTDADYARMDSLLAQPTFVADQLAQDKQMLMFPAGSILSDNIQRDPLNFFTPVVQKLQPAESGLKYEMYDGHIFSPDMQRAIVVMESPYGSSESENNARLAAMLTACGDTVMASHENLDIHIIGGPIIAATNASQIKSDSILSVAIAVILILALLMFSFRNMRNLLLIAFSIGWGWLFAMGGLALFHDKVSVIVIGISSVILGIAVNYPLHFIAHLSHTPNKKRALREIVMPLLVGNVTTVGAFLALVPLQSVALRDLGLFSSLILAGTIIFVLVYLPHLAKASHEECHTFLDRISDVTLENKPVFVTVVVALTLVFGYFSFQTQFDTNLAHINYMTDQQKADMAYFQRTMLPSGGLQKVYAISSDTTMDGALDKSRLLQPGIAKMVADGQVQSASGCSQFVVSKAEQKRRLALWDGFVERNRDRIHTMLNKGMRAEGFAKGSFDDFYTLLDTKCQPHDISYFSPLVKTLFAGNISTDAAEGRYNVVDVLAVKDADMGAVEEQLKEHDCHSFDVVAMNSAIANHLSNDFNYIGFACGFIVFFFLWLSFGSLELALLSFVPMAISWLWILGIMSLFGMQFNIVNIILATFIFGQGDDYTIFMTEGAMYEYAYRKKMLASYKHSIIISALIMFIGIGTLIVARHPALHSLAEVTIAGMFSVVLMAYVFPPLIFKFLVQSRRGFRYRPLSLRPMVTMALATVVFLAQLFTVQALGFLLFVVLKPTPRRRTLFHRYVQRLYCFDLNHIPSVKYRLENASGENFSKPAMIVANHQSMLDAAVFMALSPKVILVSNGRPANFRLVRSVYHWLGFVSLTDDAEANLEHLRRCVDEGYSLVVFPEGVRNDKSSILRFHKGAFHWAEQLGLDIVPVMLHGFNQVVPRGSVSAYPGELTVTVGKRIQPSALGSTYVERTQAMHRLFVEQYAATVAERETANYFHHLVLDRYRYKGTDLYNDVRRTLRRNSDFAQWIDNAEDADAIIVVGCDWGEFALLYSLVHRECLVVAVEADDDHRRALTYAHKGLDSRLQVVATIDEALSHVASAVTVKAYTFGDAAAIDGITTAKIELK